jgi:hypothetical protein
MPTIIRPRAPLWSALRAQIQNTREAHVTRKALEREIAMYTTQSDLDDLHAILNCYSDEQTADIRRILSRRAA